MFKDKYSAVWLSHSSIRDYLKCPRVYFLRNVYKDPKTGHKITRMQPPLALGQAVHEVIESLSTQKKELRFIESIMDKFEISWAKVSAKLGGFESKEEELLYKNRGKEMMQKIIDNPGPLSGLAVKIKQDLPFFWLSEEDNIILCGKIDWLKFDSEENGVKIIDFKTGKQDEDSNSLQLPIYYLLATNCQKHKVLGASYWYLEKDIAPRQVALPDKLEAEKRVIEISKKIALARKLNHLKCHFDGCSACLPLEAILDGNGELVGTSDYNQDIYVLK